MVKPFQNPAGYLYVHLYNGKLNNKKTYKTLAVHRIVAIAFVVNNYNFPQINHKDENKSNNCADNLEWCTNKYNMNYGTRIERQIKNTNYYSQKRMATLEHMIENNKKPVIQFSKEGEFISRYDSIKEATIALNTTSWGIIAVCKQLKGHKTAGGYIWKYENERNDDLLVSQF